MDWFNVLAERVGEWALVLILLVAMWFVGGIPVAVKGWLEKNGKKVPAWYEDHIVLIEIVWIVVAFWLIGSRIPL